MYPSDPTIYYFIVILILALILASLAIIRPIFTKKKIKNAGACGTKTSIFMGSHLHPLIAFVITTSFYICYL
jgi:hypothetical protein